MMKQYLLSFVLSTGFAASLAAPAFAQDNPNTTQTDQSEEDWRKSKKKTSTDDPWNGFKNTNGWGQGTQRSMSPVDMLPEDSRRFLMKERAERLAEAGIGEPVDTSFEPSDAAKSDPSLETDEKAAWSEMMKDMGGMPPAGGPNGDPNADPNTQGGGAPQIPTQVGERGSSSSGGSSGSAGAPPSSMMRGGSQASVSDILAQIKGGGMAPSGQTQGQSSQGQSSQGQGQQGQSQQGQTAQGQAPTAAQMQGQAQGQSQGQNQNQGQNQGQAQAQSQSQNDAQNSADGQAQSQAQAQAAANAAKARTPEAISPLDRLKQSREDRESGGTRSSASDFLKRGN